MGQALSPGGGEAGSGGGDGAGAGSAGADARRAAAEQAFGELHDVVASLRDPERGCPWDLEQTPQTLRTYVLEEAYEVIEAIDEGQPRDVCEELGDLLFQVVFQARIYAERGAFDLAAVARGVAEKLVRRHPHVFGDEADRSHAGISRRWEHIKAEERRARAEAEAAPRVDLPAGADAPVGADLPADAAGAGPPLGAARAAHGAASEPAASPSALDGVPRALPALARAQKLQQRAARVGFDWPSIGGVLDKLDEERAELAEAMTAGEQGAIEAELGDVLFTVVNLARFLRVDAEDALRRASARFESRFRQVEAGLAAEGRSAADASLDELEARWQRAKTGGAPPR